MQIPESHRPSLSGYIQPGKLLPWKWVDARMSEAFNYWISTHNSVYPSSRPVWGIWQSPVLWYSTSSAIKTNTQRDPRVQVNLESADEVVIIQGTVSALAEADAEQWANLYNKKYNWDMPVTSEDCWQVRPDRVLAWTSDSSGLDSGAGFSNSATEWVFDSR